MAPTTTTHTDRLREAAVALRLELKRASGNIDRSRLAVLRATITIDEIDPADWLCGVTARPRIFWAGRDDSRSTGAAGVAHRIKSTGRVKVGAVVDDMRTRLATSSDDSIRYYGGFRFDMGLETPADQWSEFGSAQFVLPRVEISTYDNKTTVAAHLVFPQDCHHLDHALEEIESLLTDTGGNIAELPGDWLRVDSPTEAGWENLLTSAMTVFS